LNRRHSLKLYQAIDHIRQGYRHSVYQVHSIYYKIDRDFVLIVRILGRENPEHRCRIRMTGKPLQVLFRL